MLETVLLNTLLGMGVVFLVLIFISLVIHLLGFIPKIVDRATRKKSDESQASVEDQVAATNAPVAKAPVAKVPVAVSKTNDMELVAVIAAAIAAAMSDELGQPVSADGLVIRSIKRRR